MKVTNNICTIICLYEDDLLKIDKKDLDKGEVILGFKITRSKNRTFSMKLTKLRRS